MVSCLRTFSSSTKRSASSSVTSLRSLTLSISSMRSPYTVPWPQPVVTVFLPVFFPTSDFLFVVTATESVSQSTCTASMSSIPATRRWLRRKPIASASGACPSVISVTSSRLSRYSVSGCSPAMEVGTISPRSLQASTAKVAGRAAFVSSGRRAFALAANVGHLHFRQLCRRGRADFRIAVAARAPDGSYPVANVVVGGAVAQRRFQVVPLLGEQAGVERAFGRYAHAAAVAAERL